MDHNVATFDSCHEAFRLHQVSLNKLELSEEFFTESVTKRLNLLFVCRVTYRAFHIKSTILKEHLGRTGTNVAGDTSDQDCLLS